MNSIFPTKIIHYSLFIIHYSFLPVRPYDTLVADIDFTIQEKSINSDTVGNKRFRKREPVCTTELSDE